MTTPYAPVEENFLSELERLITQRKYVGVLYFTPLRELTSTSAILKEIYILKEASYLRLSTGEEVRLDQLVSVNDRQAPGYQFDDYTCDC